MRVIKIIFILLLLYIASGCNSNKIFEETHTFSNYQWRSDEKVAFSFNLAKEHIGTNYFLVINLRYIHGFPYKYLHFKLRITRPDGTEAIKEISVQIATDDKKYRGEGIGDYWDLDYQLKENIPFKLEGNYYIEIFSMMEEDPVNFINNIGISLVKETN